MKENTIINRETAQKILCLVDKGLTSGLGQPIPGQMCIMAVFNNALGRKHSDSGLEDCVGEAVRGFDIGINDASWSSDQARSKGMRREAVAKIGSNQIDQKEFSKRLSTKIIQKLLPQLFRDVAKVFEEPHKAKLLEAATNMETSESPVDAAHAARYAAADAAAARYAHAAAAAAADAAADAAHAAAAAAAARYAAAAAAARYAAAATARYAADAAHAAADAAHAAAAAARYAAADKYLSLACELAVEVLVELKSPGTEWLDICDKVC